jgi:hypothetical protein
MERQVRNRLIVALLASIAMIAVAGYFSAKIGGQADLTLHEGDHVTINMGLLKFQLDHPPIARKP